MNDLKRLNEMGISVWELRNPQLFTPKPATQFSLPETCKLLFVNNKKPTSEDAWLFGKILSSLHLLPNQALQIPFSQIKNMHKHALEWCWFCDCTPVLIDGVHCFSSPSLLRLSSEPNEKQKLWRKIKSLIVKKLNAEQ